MSVVVDSADGQAAAYQLISGNGQVDAGDNRSRDHVPSPDAERLKAKRKGGWCATHLEGDIDPVAVGDFPNDGYRLIVGQIADMDRSVRAELSDQGKTLGIDIGDDDVFRTALGGKRGQVQPQHACALNQDVFTRPDRGDFGRAESCSRSAVRGSSDRIGNSIRNFEQHRSWQQIYGFRTYPPVRSGPLLVCHVSIFAKLFALLRKTSVAVEAFTTGDNDRPGYPVAHPRALHRNPLR